MRPSIVFLSSGQGTQYFNMTNELYTRNQTYHHYLDEINEYIYEITSYSVLQYIFDKSKNFFVSCNDLQLSSLALFLCQYSLGKLLIERGINPDCIVGSSMGEFVALALSNDKYLEEVIKILFQCVRKVERKCKKGGMLAILHGINIFYEQREVFGDCEIAGINYDENFVVSGSNSALKNVIHYLKENGIVFQRISVQYAFHSKMIDEVKEEIKNGFSPWKLQVPIGSCAYGNIIEELPHSYIWDVIRLPMQFQETIQRIEERMNPIYVDLGPNGTLSNFIKRRGTLKNKSYFIINMYNKENENLEKLMNDFKTINY